LLITAIWRRNQKICVLLFIITISQVPRSKRTVTGGPGNRWNSSHWIFPLQAMANNTPRMWGGEIRIGILVFNYLRVKPTRPFHPGQTDPPIQNRIE